MIVLTAANYKFKDWLSRAAKTVDAFGYKFLVYDLGGLGYGTKFEIDNLFFQKKGFYSSICSTWKTKALHKPAIVEDCMNKYDDFIVYVDADTLITSELNLPKGFDLGVTVRRPDELDKEPVAKNREIMGSINAGVIFFNNAPHVKKFVQSWKKLTLKVNNDQLALNQIINPSRRKLIPDEQFDVDDIKVLTFPTDIYNFYYFPESPEQAKILHYKNNLWKRLGKGAKLNI